MWGALLCLLAACVPTDISVRFSTQGLVDSRLSVRNDGDSDILLDYVALGAVVE